MEILTYIAVFLLGSFCGSLVIAFFVGANSHKHSYNNGL